MNTTNACDTSNETTKRDRMENTVFATVNPDTKRKLVEIAKGEKRSLSQLIRVILEEAVENSRYQ